MLEKTLEISLDCKEIQPVHSKWDQSWIFIGRTDAEAETPILGPMMRRTDSLEKTLMLGKIEGGRRRGRRRMRCWMESPTQWTWVWARSGSWWWTGRPGVLQSMGSQRVGRDWATELKIYWVPTMSWIWATLYRYNGAQNRTCPCLHGVYSLATQCLK